jgi:hypothetical protein
MINKKLDILSNQIKQKFMIVLRAENTENLKELGVGYLETECPVLLMNPIKVDNPVFLDWKKKSLVTVLENEANNEDI